jgi:membrane associated rhomboid family serine protease
LIIWIILHLAYVVSDFVTPSVRRSFDRNFECSLTATWRPQYKLYTLLTSPFLHKSTNHLISNSLSLFSIAPLLMDLFQSELELILFVLFVSICSSLGVIFAESSLRRHWGMVWRGGWVGASGLLAGMRTFVMFAAAEFSDPFDLSSLRLRRGALGWKWSEHLALQLVLDAVLLNLSPHAMGAWFGGVLSAMAWFLYLH